MQFASSVGRDAAGFGTASPAADVARTRDTIMADLLAAIRWHACWEGASVERAGDCVVIKTSRHSWHYAAMIDLPTTLPTMKEPYLCLRLSVARGRIGICVMGTDQREILAEHAVSETSDPLRINIELPKTEGASVIFRNTVDDESKAVVVEATLCDRVA